MTFLLFRQSHALDLQMGRLEVPLKEHGRLPPRLQGLDYGRFVLFRFLQHLFRQIDAALVVPDGENQDVLGNQWTFGQGNVTLKEEKERLRMRICLKDCPSYVISYADDQMFLHFRT